MFRSAPVVEQKGGGIGVRFTGFTRVGREGGGRQELQRLRRIHKRKHNKGRDAKAGADVYSPPAFRRGLFCPNRRDKRPVLPCPHIHPLRVAVRLL